jgi:hypothetical protein
MPIAEFEKLAGDDGSMVIDGVRWERDFQAELGVTADRYADPWAGGCEMLSAAVHRQQVKELGDKLAAHGCPAEFSHRHAPIATSRSHRNKILKVMGFYDRDAGYSDRTPTQF